MAFYSYPFESQNTGTASQPVYDRAITAENERQFNKLRYTNGVFIESALDDDLQVIPGNGMSVKVSKGGCHIEGALAYNDNAVTLSLEAANATLRRIDRVVARFNTSTNVRSIMVYVKTGTNATNPVAPLLQRESNFWEIGLADITIPAGATSISASNILDTRMDDSLCGRVLPAIPYITQLGSLYEQYQELVSSALSGTVAGQLEARISAEENKVQPITKGGTGATTATEARKAILENKALSIAEGGTGATTAAAALLALGVSDYVTEEGETSDGINGYIKFASGLMFQWGSKGVQTGQGESTLKVDFPTAFKDTKYRFLALGNYNFVGGITIAENIYTTGRQNRTTTSTTVSIYKTANPYWYAIDWFAIGRWK